MVENQEMSNECGRNAVKRDYRTAFLPSELGSKFSSKSDLLTYLSEHRKSPSFNVWSAFVVQYYVPPASSINKDFLRQVLKGEKKLLKVSECKFVNVPKFDELGVNNIFPKFKQDASVMVYLQDEYARNRFPDRTYFYTVLNTVHSEYVANLIANSQQARYAADAEQNQSTRVPISQEWWDNLNSMPFVSRKSFHLSNPLRF